MKLTIRYNCPNNVGWCQHKQDVISDSVTHRISEAPLTHKSNQEMEHQQNRHQQGKTSVEAGCTKSSDDFNLLLL